MHDTTPFPAASHRFVLASFALLGAAGSCSKSDSTPAAGAASSSTAATSGVTTGASGGGSPSTGTTATAAGTGGAGGSGMGGAGGSGPSDAGGGQDVTIAPGTPGVRFVGRFDKTNPAQPKFSWSGSGIIAQFSGTSAGIKLAGGQQYTVLVDGMLRPKLIPTSGTSPIASGLAAGPHTVEVYRRTEANQGDSQFLGFDFGTGVLLAPPPTPDRRIEVIGDSITCGYGNEGADMNCPFTPDTENHYLTYEALAARTLGADLITIAWSGKGVVCNYGDDPTSCVDPFPPFYDRTLGDQATSQWDFSWQPQVVVINLGTNDFSTAVDPTEAQFSAGYKSFLQHIRSKYPGALILCTVAPLLSGNDLATSKSYISKTVMGLADPKIKTFDMAAVDPADGFGCDWHPSLKTHQKMAVELTARLRSELGW